MSNFIKMNYVAQRETSARVINPNSNPTMVAKEQEWAHTAKEASDVASEEGFQEGISAPVIDPHETAAQILEDARSQADQILNDAAAKAQQTRMDAEQEAAAIFEDRKAAGFAEGKAQADSYLAEQKEALEQELAERMAGQEEEYQEKFKQMESDIVDAISDVLEKTFHVFIHDEKEVLLFLINKSIQKLETGKNYKVRVSANNFKFVSDAVPELKEKVGNDVEIDVQNDGDLDDSACIIETDYGLYHCGIDTQLENLLVQMKALSM